MPEAVHRSPLALSEREQEEALHVVSHMVKFDSQTETPGETELAVWLVDHMRSLGLEADLHEVSPGRYNAVGTWRGTGEGQSLLFNGHLDTNPVTEGWTVDPWGGHIDEQFIYGLGVSNMKAGCASYLQAVSNLMSQGVKLPGDVVLTFVVGELQGGVGTLKLLEDGLTADWFVNCEPTDLSALTLHAGAFDYIVELVGNTRHSSKREDAVDALAAAAALVPRLNALKLNGANSEDHERVNRVHAGVLHAALGRDLAEWRPPQVADYAKILGTCRYAPSQSVEGVLTGLRTLAEELVKDFPGLQAEVRRHDRQQDRAHMPPFEVDTDSHIVQVLNRAHTAIGRGPQQTGAIRPYCFYGSDAAHLQHRAGIPGVVCGPGGRYNTMPDERVDIADYFDMIKMHMMTIQEICSLKKEEQP
ncbi:M20 family metallopeptidase [Ornithinimicrobium sufpigmenti]|uniref:M20 family metallopeptidase n=1 Tax=Ornithinimicrobium sufpigmenti TaxID=2508882 RepID=UPI00192D2B63|nr:MULTISPECIES: M20/M25/M40 family metallo-hydrolase [unclassified Ornithinimicrobium]